MKSLAAILALCATCWVYAGPIALTVNSDAGDSADRLLRIDLADGRTLATVANFMPPGNGQRFGDIEGLAFDRDGLLYAIDDDTKSLITVSTTSGAVQLVGSSQLGNTRLAAAPLDPSIAFACTGELLLAGATNRSLYRVNLSTGTADLLGAAGGLGVELTDIAASIGGVYGLGETGLYKINMATFRAELIGSYGSNVNFSLGGGMAFDETGALWAVADRGLTAGSSIYRLNTSTGAATLAGLAAPGLESLAIGPSPCTSTITGPATPVEVPTLSPIGWFGLALLLLFAGRFSMGFSRT